MDIFEFHLDLLNRYNLKLKYYIFSVGYFDGVLCADIGVVYNRKEVIRIEFVYDKNTKNYYSQSKKFNTLNCDLDLGNDEQIEYFINETINVCEKIINFMNYISNNYLVYDYTTSSSFKIKDTNDFFVIYYNDQLLIKRYLENNTSTTYTQKQFLTFLQNNFTKRILPKLHSIF